jgi:serine phosphatase RsbU (regulator of sigma subunit)
MLVLFTDGLVEVPGRPLDDTMRELSSAVAAGDDGEPLEGVCDRILATIKDRELRDDIALLTIRLAPAEPALSDDRTSTVGARE